MSEEVPVQSEPEAALAPEPIAPASGQAQRGVIRGDRGLQTAQVIAAAFIVAVAAALLHLGALYAPLHGPDQVLFLDPPRSLPYDRFQAWFAATPQAQQQSLLDTHLLHRLVTVPQAFGIRPDAPLTLLGYARNLWLPGDASTKLHMLSILLLAADAVLLFLLARKLAGPGTPEAVPMLAGLLFAAHPLAAPAAYIVAARPMLQATFFGLIALLLLARGARQRGMSSIVLPILFYAMAVASASAWLVAPLLAWGALIVARLAILGEGVAVFAKGGNDTNADDAPPAMRFITPLFAFFAAGAVLLVVLAALGLPPFAADFRVAFQRCLSDGAGFLRALATFSAPEPLTSSTTGSATLLAGASIAFAFLAGACMIVMREALGVGLFWIAVAVISVAFTTPADDAGRHLLALCGASLLLPAIIARIPAGTPRAICGALAAVAVLAGAFFTYNATAEWGLSAGYWAARANARPDDPNLFRYLAKAAEQAAASSTSPQDASAYAAAAESAWARLGPEDSEALRHLALAKLKRGENDDARALFQQAVERDPFDRESTLQLAQLDEQWVQVSGKDFQLRPAKHEDADLNRERRAADYFARAAALGALPDSARLQYGFTLALLGNPRGAVDVLGPLAEKGGPPELAKAVEQFKKNLAAADGVSAQAREAMAKSPADALAKEANAHLLRNEILPARYMLQQAYAKDASNLKAWVQLGLLSLRARDIDRFLGEYGRSQAANDKLWIELAARSAEAGAWDEARTFLNYNATLSPSATLPQYTLAEIADVLKQPERADAYLQDAATTRPADPDPWLRLADRAIAAKQNDKAAAALAEAEKRGASPSALEERRKKGVAPAAPTRPGIERSVIR